MSKCVTEKNCDAFIVELSFWNNVVYTFKIAGPLVKVLRLKDGEKKPPVGYIYEAMAKTIEATTRSFNENETEIKGCF